MKSIKIIGAGISGLTFARLFADRKIHVDIFESRSFIGGNCKCYFENEIEVHKYGPHIFHTSNIEVWNFLKRFTDFNSFQLNVLAKTDKGNFFLPFGLSLLNNFFHVELSPNQVDDFLTSKRIPIKSPKNLEEKALSLVGKEIYETFIKGYTEKQWGINPKNLPSSIIERLPFRKTYSINYYNDTFSGIPLNGYEEMFQKMIDSEFIHIHLNSKFSLDDYDTDSLIIFTGQIDRLFNYRFGILPWRSLKFEYERLDIDNFQGNAVVNFPLRDIPYTRQYEFKWFHPETKYSRNETMVCREYPKKFEIGDEPFYPIENEENRKLHQKYLDYSLKNYSNLVFCGRLASYKYLDMDDAVANAFETFASLSL